MVFFKIRPGYLAMEGLLNHNMHICSRDDRTYAWAEDSSSQSHANWLARCGHNTGCRGHGRQYQRAGSEDHLPVTRLNGQERTACQGKCWSWPGNMFHKVRLGHVHALALGYGLLPLEVVRDHYPCTLLFPGSAITCKHAGSHVTQHHGT